MWALTCANFLRYFVFLWYFNILSAHARRHNLNPDSRAWQVFEPRQSMAKLGNFDESPWLYDSEKKEQFTFMLKTTADGEVFGPPLVCFARQSQFKYKDRPGLVNVEGVPFFVARNDTHHNNTILHFLWYLAGVNQSCITPCQCGNPTCKDRMDNFDNASCHFWKEVFDVTWNC